MPETPPPWEQRDTLGLWTAFYETTRRVITEPTAFFREMAVGGGIGAPLAYGVLVATIGYLLLLAQVGLVHVLTPRELDQPPLSEDLVAMLVLAALTPFGATLILFVEAGMTHIVLVVLKAAHRGFEATLRTSCYSHGTWIFFALPCLGCAVGLVWFVVVRIIAVAQTQRTSNGKAAVAVLGPNLAMACCATAIQVAFLGLGFFALMLAAILGGSGPR
jgi:hypothetical protein